MSIHIRHKEEEFYNKGVNTLKESAQRYGRSPVPGNIQGQTERGDLD